MIKCIYSNIDINFSKIGFNTRTLKINVIHFKQTRIYPQYFYFNLNFNLTDFLNSLLVHLILSTFYFARKNQIKFLIKRPTIKKNHFKFLECIYNEYIVIGRNLRREREKL